MMFVCNTGPLIALATIDQLSLLQHMASEGVLTPPRVQKELWGKIGPESARIESALSHFIHETQIDRIDPGLESATSDLHAGEKEGIVLGTSLQDNAVLLPDDQAGRRTAQALGLSVLGPAGLLL